MLSAPILRRNWLPKCVAEQCACHVARSGISNRPVPYAQARISGAGTARLLHFAMGFGVSSVAVARWHMADASARRAGGCRHNALHEHNGSAWRPRWARTLRRVKYMSAEGR